jgi:DNA repair exonuclease SbcCD ATPase subunit
MGILISIKNFGPFVQLKLTLPASGLLCLHGSSGCGKTSLLNAISWCLTGEPKRGIIRDDTDAKAEVSVNIKFDDILISRRKRPERLIVQVGQAIYNDQVGQDYIDQLWGGKGLLKSTTYLAQKQLHPLISGSANDRFAIIKELAFSIEDPQKYIDILIAQMNNVELSKAGLQTELVSLEHQMSKLDQSQLLDRINLIELKTELKSIPGELNQLNIQLKKAYHNKGKFDIISAELKAIEASRSCVSFLDRDHINGQLIELKARRDQLIVKQAKLKESETKRHALIKLRNDLNGVDLRYNPTKETWLLIRDQERQYLEAVKFTQSNQLEYKSADLEAFKKQLDSQIEINHYLDQLNELDRLTQELSQVTPSEKTIAQLTDEITAAKRSLELLTCPQCQAKLKYKDGQLNLEIQTVCFTVDEIKSLELELKRTKQQARLDELNQLIPSQIRQSSRSTMSIKKLKSLRQQIDQIKLIDAPEINAKTIEKLIEYHQVLTNNIELIDSDVDIDRELKDVIKQIDLFEQSNLAIINKAKLEAQLMEFKGTDKPNDLEIKIKQLIERQNRLQVAIEYGNLESKIDQVNERLEPLIFEVNRLTSFKDLAVELSYKVLDETVETLNANLNSTLATMFEAPIQVSVDLFREVKSRGISKPNVNLNVVYKGRKDALDKMSGGEIDRLSIGLTLSCAAVTKTPLLMLDEQFASLNDSLRTLAKDAIAKYASDKLAIIVSHNDVLGDYTDNINLEQLIE